MKHLSASAREKKHAAASFVDRAVIGCRPSVASQPELGLSSQRSTGRRSVSGHRAGVDGSSVEAVLTTPSRAGRSYLVFEKFNQCFSRVLTSSSCISRKQELLHLTTDGLPG